MNKHHVSHALRGMGAGFKASDKIFKLSDAQGYLLGWGTSADIPSDGDTGWAKGAVFIDLTNGVMYENVGSVTSADFDKVGFDYSSAAATISIGDDSATAFKIAEGSNAYMTFVTTDGGEKITVHKDLDLDADLDVSSQATSISIIDNNAAALDIKEGTNSYLKFVTTDGSEKVVVGKDLDLDGDLDVSTQATTVSVLDDNAAALDIAEGANSYLKVVTTDNKEQVEIAKCLAQGTQTIDMADASVTLVRAGTGGTLLTASVLLVDPNSSGADEDLLLPPEADCTGLVLDIYNTGGEGIVVKDDSGASTLVTIATAKAARLVCDGTSWYVLAGA